MMMEFEPLPFSGACLITPFYSPDRRGGESKRELQAGRKQRHTI